DLLVLGAEDLLLVLCAHATKHSWSRLVWICDVARLVAVAGTRMAWPEVFARARAAGASRILSLGLLLANRVLMAPLPEDVLARLRRDAAAICLAEEIAAGMFEQRRDDTDFRGHLFFLKSRERWRDRFGYLSRLAFT